MSQERLAELITRLHELAEPVVAAAGLELVDLELRGGTRGSLLRVYVDTAGRVAYRGSAKAPADDHPEVSVADCARISRDLSPILDVEDLIQGAYVLEVSSPGVNRHLKTPIHFKRAEGLKVKLRVRAPVGPDDLTNFVADLVSSDDEGITVALREGPVTIPYRLIARANLEYQF